MPACSIVGCTNNSTKEECKKNGVHFFSFPTRDPEQRELWISAVKRLTKEGQTWRPKSKNDKICSEHFVSGQWSRTRGHPSYVPSIKLGHNEKKGKTDKDLARFQRHQKRQLEKDQVPSVPGQARAKRARGGHAHVVHTGDASEELRADGDSALGGDQNHVRGEDIPQLENVHVEDQPTEISTASNKKKDVKEIAVQTDIEFTSHREESILERFPSISTDVILEQCQRIKDMKRDGAGLEEIYTELDVLYKLEQNAMAYLDVGLQVSIIHTASKGTQKGYGIEKVTITQDIGISTDIHVVTKDAGSSTDVSMARVGQIDFGFFGARQFKALTGATRDMVACFLEALGSSLKGSKKMSREQKLLLFLMKIKLNLSFTVLGALFCVCDAVAGHWFYHVKDRMVELARIGVYWMDRETVKARMPQSFRDLYPSCRCIIDCTEIFTQKPGKQRQRVQMYSTYKSHFTLKYLIACAPSGMKLK